MKTIRLSILLVVAAICGTLGAQTTRTQDELKQLMQDRGEYYFTLNVEDLVGIENLGELCSVDGTNGKIVVAYANQQEYDKLIELGLRPNLQTPPSLREEAEMWDGNKATYEWNSYLTYDQYVTMMQGFPASALNDRTCTYFELGTLTSGRKLMGIHIYSGSPAGKPKFLYSSTMHGDEVTGMILMLRLIDELCTSTDSRIVSLLNDVDIYILPLTNPDGTYHGGNSTVTGATRANGNSIDLNRNYKDYYKGDHPDNKAYQNETIWTMAFGDEHLFTMSANYHGGAEVMNYPWDAVYDDPADTDWFEYVCTEYVQIARQTYSSYMTDTYSDGVTNGADWYVITGSRQDYMNAYAQCREVTVECSTTKTPAANQLPNFWNYNRNSMLAFMEQARNGVHGIVYDAVTEQPIEGVTVTVQNHDSETSFVTTHSVGDFHRPIKGGTYTFVFAKEGYCTEKMAVSVADGEREDLEIYLYPEGSCPLECYEQTTPSAAGSYLLGYLNGSALVMPTHNNASTVTATSFTVNPTDTGFSAEAGSITTSFTLAPYGSNGQYYIQYNGRYLAKSNQGNSLTWSTSQPTNGRWYINANGIYITNNSTNYYLNYSNGFTTSNTNQNNVHFYVEGECPVEGYSVIASYDNTGGTVTFSCGDANGTNLNGLAGGETINVNVTVNEGYSFGTITAADADNNPVSLTQNGDGTYSFIMPEANVTVTVTFEAIDYTVNLAPDINHGTVLVNGSESLCDAHAGQTITVTATPDPGFELNMLYYIAEGTTTEVTITGNNFTMPAANVTLYATFAKDCGGEVTYERVTEAPTDWSGTYLLVYQSSTTATSGYAFNGTLSGGDGYSTDITISGGNTITELGSAAELTIEKVDGNDYYYIKNSSNYLYAESSNLYEGATASGNTYQWSLAMSGNYVNIHTAASSYPLYFNANASGTYSHHFYPTSQSNNTANVYLYRKTQSSSAATVSFSPESGTTLSEGNNTVTLTSSIAGLPIYYTTDGTEPTLASAHDISPVTLTFNDVVTVKAFTYDDPDDDGCGIGPMATATYGWAIPACYERVTSVSAGNYVMGHLDGNTLVMPTHNSNQSSMTVTQATVIPTDNGFSVLEDLPKVTLTAYGSNGQYYIQYNDRYLAVQTQYYNSSSLTWSQNQTNAGWNIDSNGIYYTSYNRTYYLYYNNGSFQLSQQQQNNISFYTEGDCPDPTITQTVTLSAGWNWFSSPVVADNLLAQIEQQLGTHGIVIKNKNGKSAIYDATSNSWFSNLNEIVVEQMYKIQTDTVCELNLDGTTPDPLEHSITIKPGANWIGFPAGQSLSVEAAFANFEPTDGDVIKGKNGKSAIYDAATNSWFSNLILEPGKGYIYQSKATENKTLVFSIGK